MQTYDNTAKHFSDVLSAYHTAYLAEKQEQGEVNFSQFVILSVVEREFLKHVRDFGKTIHWKSAVIISCLPFTMGVQGET